jgi:hypothetical protein
MTTIGRDYVYHGSPTGLTVPAWTMNSDSPDTTKFGADVSGIGDVNGDGFDDVIIAAIWYTADLFRQGRAWVYLGTVSGLSGTPAWMNTGIVEVSYYGAGGCGAGGVNGRFRRLHLTRCGGSGACWVPRHRFGHLGRRREEPGVFVAVSVPAWTAAATPTCSCRLYSVGPGEGRTSCRVCDRPFRMIAEGTIEADFGEQLGRPAISAH